MRPTNTATQEVERQIEANQPQQQQSSEQAADLAALSAAALAGEPVPVPGAEPVPDTGQTLADEFVGLGTLLMGVLGPAFPSVKAIYTPEVIQTASAVTAAVFVKHGWCENGVMGKYSEEIAAAAIMLPLGVATVQAVKADLAARKAEAEKAKGKPPAVERVGGLAPVSVAAVPTEQPGARTVTVGAPMPASQGGSA